MEFIGLEEQPLSVVENMGFQRMTWSYVSPQYKYLMHFPETLQDVHIYQF